MDAYTMRRWLRRPIVPWRRRRTRRHGAYDHAVFESQDHRPSLLHFAVRARRERFILVDAELRQGAVALDVGAFEGLWSGRLLERADQRGVGAVTIHAFEPIADAVRSLRETFASEPRVVVHPYGLAGSQRRERMTVGGPGSSAFVDPASRPDLDVEQVELRDIAAVLDEIGADRIDLVKLNIEGGEFEVIARLHETGWLERTGTMIVQFHEFAPRAHRARRRARRQLQETHRCTWSYPWVYERWDRR